MSKSWSKKGFHKRNKIDKLINIISPQLEPLISIGLEEMIPCGSFRRGNEYCGDLDLLFIVKLESQISPLLEWIRNKLASEILTRGKVKSSILIGDVQVDLVFATTEQKEFALLHHTGPVEENVRMRFKAKHKGFKLNEKGLFKDNQLISYDNFKSEKDIYDYIRATYKDPNERER
jgi:DNA polymerase/3'-5' exonuclease PolX